MLVEPYKKTLRASVRFMVVGTEIHMRNPADLSALAVLKGERSAVFYDILSRDHFGAVADPYRPEDLTVTVERNIKFYLRQVTLPETYMSKNLQIRVLDREILNK